MNQELTTHQRWLSRKYLAYQLLTNLWFLSAVWLYFYRLFITDQQVGALDGLAFALGLLAEVPSGALADRFGRSRLVKIGQALVALGFLTQGIGSHYFAFLIGQSMITIGMAFISGADDALFFDQLGFNKGTTFWRKLVTRGTQLSLVGTLGATIAGGWLYGLNPRLPWILTSATFLVSIFFIWSVEDTRTNRAAGKFLKELREHLGSIKSGFQEFHAPQLRLYIPIIVVVQGLFYAAGWGLLRVVLLSQFRFDPFQSSIVLATINIITVGLLTYIHKNADNLSERLIITVISIAAALGLLLSLADIGWWGFVVIFTLYAGEHILYPFLSEVLNNHTEESRRATVLSVASFMRAAPYVILGPIIGYLSTNGNLKYFLIIWAAIIFVSVLAYLSLRGNGSAVNMTQKEIAQEKRLPETE